MLLTIIPLGDEPCPFYRPEHLVDFYRGLGVGGIEFAVERDGSSGSKVDSPSIMEIKQQRKRERERERFRKQDE